MKVSRELLMRFHDGEATDEEVCAVELALEREPALIAELEAYAELGSFVRVWGEQRLQAPVDIADSVMAQLEPRRARVASLLPRVATWVSVGVAIAAGSVLVVRSWTAPLAVPGAAGAAGSVLVAPNAAMPPDLPPALQGEAEPKPAPATIESVDFGTNTGTVFVVSTDSSETPVVWMPDDGEPDEDDVDRSESL